MTLSGNHVLASQSIRTWTIESYPISLPINIGLRVFAHSHRISSWAAPLCSPHHYSGSRNSFLAFVEVLLCSCSLTRTCPQFSQSVFSHHLWLLYVPSVHFAMSWNISILLRDRRVAALIVRAVPVNRRNISLVARSSTWLIMISSSSSSNSVHGSDPLSDSPLCAQVTYFSTNSRVSSSQKRTEQKISNRLLRHTGGIFSTASLFTGAESETK